MAPHWLNVITRCGRVVIRYVDANSLHDELRKLYHDRRISRGTLAALINAYREAGLDEHSIRQWTKANRHRTARSVGWIPRRARLLERRSAARADPSTSRPNRDSRAAGSCVACGSALFKLFRITDVEDVMECASCGIEICTIIDI